MAGAEPQAIVRRHLRPAALGDDLLVMRDRLLGVLHGRRRQRRQRRLRHLDGARAGIEALAEIAALVLLDQRLQRRRPAPAPPGAAAQCRKAGEDAAAVDLLLKSVGLVGPCRAFKPPLRTAQIPRGESPLNAGSRMTSSVAGRALELGDRLVGQKQPVAHAGVEQLVDQFQHALVDAAACRRSGRSCADNKRRCRRPRPRPRHSESGRCVRPASPSPFGSTG